MFNANCADSRPAVRRAGHASLLRFARAAVALCLMANSGTMPVFAQSQQGARDRVHLQRPGRTGGIGLRCTIIDYTGESITIRTVDGMIRSYPAAQVRDVQTPQIKPHVQGLLAFTRNDNKQAQSQFQLALVEETREWVRREILAMLVRCALKRGEYAVAQKRFAAIAQSDPKTPHFSLIPLAWSPRDPSAEEKTQARQWLQGTDPAAKLMAASILLHDTDWGDAAQTALTHLSAGSDSRINSLAPIQLWRKRLRSDVPGQHEAESWKKQVDRLPDKLRAGPYFLLGRTYLARRQNEQAAAAFLWLPLVYDDDHHLAARACLEAADALEAVGQTREAVSLYREVAVRYADTEFAQEAVAQLKKRAPSNSHNQKSP